MPPWLVDSLKNNGNIPIPELFLRIGLALLLGWIVALLYQGTHRTEPYGPTFPRTLVLLSILIAMVTQVIGDSVARAFSLVGALSIVRFRTVVSDTQDTAFVIFAVIVGMAAGSNHWKVALVGILVVGLAIILLRPRGKSNVWLEDPCDLTVRVAAGTSLENVLQETFKTYLKQYDVSSVRNR